MPFGGLEGKINIACKWKDCPVAIWWFRAVLYAADGLVVLLGVFLVMDWGGGVAQFDIRWEETSAVVHLCAQMWKCKAGGSRGQILAIPEKCSGVPFQRTCCCDWF